MNILFLNINNFDNFDEAGLYHDLIRKFRDMGHNMYVVYPGERRTKQKTEHKIYQNINFLKVQTSNITKTNSIEKGISIVLLEHLFIRAINKYLRGVKFDLILYATPPVTLTNIINYIKKRDKAKTYLMLKDIFPQNAIDLKLLHPENFIAKYFSAKERKLYQLSDFIGTMSKANSDYIITKRYVDYRKVEICPNTITPVKIIVEETKKKYIYKKLNIPNNKRVFIYGGNIGKPQGVDFLVDCIRANERNSKSFFVIVGSGTDYSKLENAFIEEKYKNSILLKQLSKYDYEILANSCDVGLVFLDYLFTIPNFPSRLLSYMQASMPVIAATDPNSDVGDVIESGNFGKKVMSNDVDEFNRVINDFATRDDLNELGNNARDYLENHYTTEIAYNVIMEHFE